MAESRGEQDARLQELWKKLDSKKKGTLDLPALKKGLQQINHPLKDADMLIRDMLTECDINQDGQISYDEFVRFCKGTEKQLHDLFQTIDRDKSGSLDRKELSLAFERSGVVVSNARLDRFFAYIDKNHDGTIDFTEWRDFLLFMPTHSAGLKSVLSYYTSTAKLSAEGDVHMSDEASSSFGTTLAFLKTSMFGAIAQLVRPPPAQAYFIHPSESEEEELDMPESTTITRPESNPKTKTFEQHTAEDVAVEDDPHMPIKPARRKAQDAQDEPLKLTDFVPDVGYFIAGAVSGITSRTATAPLDRLKVFLITQTGQSKAAIQAAKSGAAVQATKHGMNSLTNAVKELWAAGGLRSLFAGNGLNIVKVMPESAVKFGSYEAAKKAIARFEGHNDPKRISGPSQFVAGGVAGMMSQAVVYPLDTLKFRMQCDTVAGGEHGNRLIWSTAQKMWARNGIVSFYRGLPMGLLGMFPYAAIDLYTFETLKKYVVNRNMKLYKCKNEEDALPGNFTMALMGGLSGAIGASTVYPINLLRTRLQSQGTASHPRTYTGIVDVTRQTIQGEGLRGLFKGLTPNLLKVVPAVSITYVVYENVKKALHLH
ncbi:hypothetical protein LTR36_003894 [Oleoguttula mirabilis]|uniref:Mitochondrial thiamine pyrophosphate carrier 1 n=1 Tax=Oleoguttula mirabilis TaxID=1507867 RepID=A0AAV9JHW2_9PEZI|nr:hypothetical protein LTR36_003894 [Oleoguttula mirabilis]